MNSHDVGLYTIVTLTMFIGKKSHTRRKMPDSGLFKVFILQLILNQAHENKILLKIKSLCILQFETRRKYYDGEQQNKD